MNRTKRSSLLFFLLPGDVRSQVRSLLTTKEYAKILASGGGDAPVLKGEAYTGHIKAFIEQMRLSKANEKRFIGKAYLALFLTFCGVSLVYGEYLISAYLLIYSAVGYWCIQRKPQSYWNIQLFSFQTQSGFILFSALSYVFLVLLLGYHNTESYAKFGWNHHPGLLFMLQASLFGPVFEEIFFRGYLFETISMGFRNNLVRHEYAGIWISSLLFAFVHLNYMNPDQILVDLAVFFVLGLALGFLRWYTRSLLHCSVVHIACNATILLLYY